MDYSHAQRVLSDLLVRRSLDVGYGWKSRQITPLDSLEVVTNEYGHPLESFPRLGPPAIPSPIVGVGVGESSDGRETIVLLTEVEIGEFDSEKLAASLGMEGLKIEEIRGGRAISTSRPAQGGESLGHSNGDTGTFGCLVNDASGASLLLSCNHVLAGLNNGQKGVDAIWQPGKKDGGSSKSRIGILHDFAYITTGGHTSNRIDAALCKPDNAADVKASVASIGSLSGSQSVPIGASVRKSGASSKLTRGKVRIRNMSIIVDYPDGVQALFDGQLGVIGTRSGQDFSTQGDSGSIIVDEQNHAVGLLISCISGVDLTIANPMQDVLSHFNATIQ